MPKCELFHWSASYQMKLLIKILLNLRKSVSIGLEMFLPRGEQWDAKKDH